MVTPIVIGVDLGTQRLKIAAVDATTWRPIGSQQASLPRFTGPDGQYEQDPADWWRLTCELIPRLLRATGIDPQHVVAIGLSGTMHSIVLLDAEGAPVHRCILWIDTRSASEADLIGERFPERLWNPSVSAYSAPKLSWLRRHDAGAFARARHLLFPKDYLRYRLTGTLGTDLSDASGSQLWDFDRGVWDDDLVSALGFDLAILPQVAPSATIAGEIGERVAAELGLAPGTRVAYGAGDVAAAVVGSGASGTDGFLFNIGTAAQVIRTGAPVTRSAQASGARFLFETGTPGRRFSMGAVPSAGLALDWWARIATPNGSPEELDGVAAPVSSAGAPPYFVPYLTGTGTPMLDEAALGAFLRLSADTDRAEMTRAVMEGVAFAIRRCADALASGSIGDATPAIVSGGVTKSPRMREILGAVLPGAVRFCEVADASLVGAVALAAAAVGIVDDPATAASRLAYGELRANPDPALRRRLDDGYEAYCSVSARLVHSRSR